MILFNQTKTNKVMAQYINKDAVLAEIKKLEKLYCYDSVTTGGRVAKSVFISINDAFNSLEVKEVDLEKEIEEYAYSLPHGTTGSCSYVSDKRLPIARQFGIKHDWDYEKVENIAEHFFELGVNASNPLTGEDIKQICDMAFEEACRLQRNMKSSLIYKEQHYQEVLKRFKDLKK